MTQPKLSALMVLGLWLQNIVAPAASYASDTQWLAFQALAEKLAVLLALFLFAKYLLISSTAVTAKCVLFILLCRERNVEFFLYQNIC